MNHLKWILEALATNPEKTGSGLAKALKRDAAAVSRMLKGERQIKADELPLIAQYLGIEIPDLSPSKNPLNDKTSLHAKVEDDKKTQFGPDTIPVLGQANGSSEAIIINIENEIGRVLRHPNQQGVKEAFALRAAGNSMAPRYREGEEVYVAGKLQPLTGQDCIVELTNGEGFLKEFVRKTDNRIICRQLNPPRKWERPLSEVKAIHAVVGRG